MKKIIFRLFILISFFLLALVPYASAQETTVKNVGFPSKNVWLSKESILEGEEVLINTLVINDAQGTFAGNMEFLDKGVLLGKTSFSVTSAQKVKIVSFSWIATAGAHEISAKMSDTTLTTVTDGKVPIIPPQISTGGTLVTVKPDKNKNGISDIDEVLATSSVSYTDKKVFSDGVKIVEDAIPDTVKEATGSIKEVLDFFRVEKNELLRGKKALNIAKIDELNEREIVAKISIKDSSTSTSTPTFTIKDHAERPLRYVYWAVLAIVGEIFNRGWLFNIFLIGGIYFLFRYIWRKVRGR